MLKSLIPTSDMCNVLGIGVAVSVRTSTVSLNCLIFSLCFTPKRCSSSTISNPRLSNETVFDSRECVPITISKVPSASLSLMVRISF